MTIEEFYILNSSGGLIYRYYRNNKYDLNRSMIVSSLLYSVGCIGRSVGDQIKNVRGRPIIILNLNGDINKKIIIYSTWTDTTFVFIVDYTFILYERLIDDVYKEYNKILRDPFYVIDGVISNIDIEYIFKRY